jgi:O-antigen ligase
MFYFIYGISSFLPLSIDYMGISIGILDFLLLTYAIMFINRIKFFGLINLIALLVLVIITVSAMNNYSGYSQITGIVKYTEYLFFIPIIIYGLYSKSNLSKNKYLIYVIDKLSLSSIIFLLYIGISLLIGNYEIDDQYNYYIGGYHKNQSGIFFQLTIFLLLINYRNFKNPIYLLFSVIALVMLILSGSRAPLLTSLLGAYCIFSYHNKLINKINVVIIILFILFILVNYGEIYNYINGILDLKPNSSEINSANSRLLLWNNAIGIISQSSLFGIGINNYAWEYGGYLAGIVDPHNAVLQIILIGGIPLIMALTLMHVKIYNSIENNQIQKDILILLLFYFITCLVGIIWVRGDGHIYWLLFWLLTVPNKVIWVKK